MILKNRFRVLGQPPTLSKAEMGVLPGHDVSTWRDCAVLVFPANNPTEWVADGEKIRARLAHQEQWLDQGWVGDQVGISSFGWLALDVCITKTVRVERQEFLEDPSKYIQMESL